MFKQKDMEKEYDSVMSTAKQYIMDNQHELLDKLNNKMLKMLGINMRQVQFLIGKWKVLVCIIISMS